MRSLADVLEDSNSFDIVDIELFDGETVTFASRVSVREGWITSVISSQSVADEKASSSGSKPLPVIEGQGRFLMPSLIDYESHFSTPNDMMLALVSSKNPYVREHLMQLMVQDGLFEIDTHGLRVGHGLRPSKLGERGAIPPSANFEKHIRFGVTTVIDQGAYPWPANYVRRSRNQWRLGDPLDLRKEFLVYADLYTSGMWASPPGLHFAYYGTDPVYNHWTDEEFKSWISRRISEGSDHIKIFYEDWAGAAAPKLNRETLLALSHAAHEHDLKVIVHNGDVSRIEDLIDARVDGNIHAPFGPKGILINDDLARRFAETVRTVTPTLSVMLSECNGPFCLSNPSVRRGFLNSDTLPYINALDEIRLYGEAWSSENPDRYRPLFQTVAKLCDANALLTLGSDAGSFGPYVEGLTLHHEMYLISEAIRMFSRRDPVIEALKAGTSNAARAYGLDLGSKVGDPRGFIRPGYRADLLLLRDSPLKDIRNTMKIEQVYKAGYVANRWPVRPGCSNPCASFNVDSTS